MDLPVKRGSGFQVHVQSGGESIACLDDLSLDCIQRPVVLLLRSLRCNKDNLHRPMYRLYAFTLLLLSY